MRALDGLLPELVATLADEIADRVARRLEAKLGTREEYTSRALPPGVSRARFVRVAPTIPGARREGRTWIVPRAAWEAARTGRRGEAARAVASVPAADVEADELLVEAGLRPTRLRVVGGGR